MMFRPMIGRRRLPTLGLMAVVMAVVLSASPAGARGEVCCGDSAPLTIDNSSCAQSPAFVIDNGQCAESLNFSIDNCERSSDFDRDGDVDLDDLSIFMSCSSGSSIPYPAGCEATDLDGDGDVDSSDFGAFQPAMGRTGVQNPACAE